MSITAVDDGKNMRLHIRNFPTYVSDEEAEQIVSQLSHLLKKRKEAQASREMIVFDENGLYSFAP